MALDAASPRATSSLTVPRFGRLFVVVLPLSLGPGRVCALCRAGRLRRIPAPNASFPHSFPLPSTFRVPAAHPLRAIIYGPDGERILEDDFDDALSANAPPLASAAVLESLARQIGEASLVRIGCAFAPPPHGDDGGLSLSRRALGASLARLGPTEVEIALDVAVGDGGGEGGGGSAAQLLVPVPLPAPLPDGGCDGPAFEEEVRSSIRILDSRASELILAAERREADADCSEEQLRIIRGLEAEPSGFVPSGDGDGEGFPDWWTFPNLNTGVEAECASLKRMLNDDNFDGELGAFFAGRLDDDDASPYKTRVASVGPSGVYLRAFVGRRTGDSERFGIEPLAVAFEEGVATSAEELRKRVLRVVSTPTVIARPSTKTGPGEEAKSRGGTRERESFQRNLLMSRLRYERAAAKAVPKEESIETVEVAAKEANSRGGTRKRESFQRNLLESRLRYERAAAKAVPKEDSIETVEVAAKEANSQGGARERESFQRNLLVSRLRYERAAAKAVPKEDSIETVEVAAKVRKDGESFQRRLLKARIEYVRRDGANVVAPLSAKGGARDIYSFQRRLLLAQLQNANRTTGKGNEVSTSPEVQSSGVHREESDRGIATAAKEEQFQRNLLGALLRNNQVASRKAVARKAERRVKEKEGPST